MEDSFRVREYKRPDGVLYISNQMQTKSFMVLHNHKIQTILLFPLAGVKVYTLQLQTCLTGSRDKTISEAEAESEPLSSIVVHRSSLYECFL